MVPKQRRPGQSGGSGHFISRLLSIRRGGQPSLGGGGKRSGCGPLFTLTIILLILTALCVFGLSFGGFLGFKFFI